MAVLEPCAYCGGAHSPQRICPAKIERFLNPEIGSPLEKAQAETGEAAALEIWHKKRPHEER